MSNPAVVFAGGGTGGHIFPMLAVLEVLRERDPAARALFLCATREIDARILGAAGVEFTPIPAAPLLMSVRALARDEAARGVMRAALAGLGPVDGAARLAAALMTDG